ncbi:MAG: hypothetical protein HMLKMBBP_02752 [Planctomycetes bacterium]|nr:hypothetical protein [Planctomycetota bacterium]
MIVRLLGGGDGGPAAELASAGTDEPAPPEWSGASPVPEEHLRTVAAAARVREDARTDLRPWFAGAAAALLAAAAWAASRAAPERSGVK